MNRRNLLKILRPKTKETTINSVPPSSGLDPYTGPWKLEQAAHLLRRTMFGPSKAQMQEVIGLGMNAAITQLLNIETPQEGPRNPGRLGIGDEIIDIEDAYVSTGSPWIYKKNSSWQMAPLPTNPEDFVIVQSYRKLSLWAWKSECILKEGISLAEKMTLFWQNHFGVFSDTAGFEFLLNATLMENALGNFRALVKQITLDPAMLVFLNGNENTGGAPNENYARELFELFTIGKGALAGPGDYSHYTEDDIAAAAKVLTGWAVNGAKLTNSRDHIEMTKESLIVFRNFHHDQGSKKFSHRFGNRTITNAGSQEYEHLIDMIFEQPECARFICRKIYRWFVFYQITDEIEAKIIEPMAQIMIDTDYEIKPALSALLKSEHFYDAQNLGPMIKNPYDFNTSIIKPFGLIKHEPSDPYEKFVYYHQLTNMFSILQMNYFAPPNVAGWKAYYQEPLFYRSWINATTLNYRMNITRGLAYAAAPEGQQPHFFFDVFKVIQEIPDAADANMLIDALSEMLFPLPITETQKDYLKGILIPGLPDFEWTVEYHNYLNNPEDQELKVSVEQKLRHLMSAMWSLPEFHLS